MNIKRNEKYQNFINSNVISVTKFATYIYQICQSSHDLDNIRILAISFFFEMCREIKGHIGLFSKNDNHYKTNDTSENIAHFFKK